MLFGFKSCEVLTSQMFAKVYLVYLASLHVFLGGPAEFSLFAL